MFLKDICKEEDDLIKSLESLERWEQPNHYKVICEGSIIHDKQAKIYKDPDGNFCFECICFEIHSAFERENFLSNLTLNIEFRNRSNSVYVLSNNITRLSYAATPGTYTKIIGIIREFHSHHNVPNYNFANTALIKCGEFDIINTFFIGSNLKLTNSTIFNKVFCIDFKQISYQLFVYKKKQSGENFLFIESSTPSEYNTFCRTIEDIVLCLNYLTGIYVGKQIFILNNSQNEENLNLKRSFAGMFISKYDLKTSERPVIAYHMLLDNRGKQFVSNTCKKSFENLLEYTQKESFKRTLLLMSNAASQPDYIKVALFSVALETISSTIMEDTKFINKVNLISDKTLWKKVLNTLNESLDFLIDSLPVETISHLKKRVLNLNQPTNNDKLKKPFDLLGLKLDEIDLDSISKRNDFLHGRLPEERDSHMLNIIAYRLAFCVNCLMLKYVDYKGVILNDSAFYQEKHTLKIESKPVYWMI